MNYPDALEHVSHMDFNEVGLPLDFKLPERMVSFVEASPLEVVARLTGYSTVVDMSVALEPHIVRGSE